MGVVKRSSIPLLLALMVLTALGAADAKAPAPRPLDVTGAQLRQHGRGLVLRVRTAEDWGPRDLHRNSLCLELQSRGRTARVCAAGRERLALRFERLKRDASVALSRRLRLVRLRRRDTRSFIGTFRLASVGLRPGTVKWRVFSSPRAGCVVGGDPSACEVSSPRSGRARLRIRRPREVGCRRRGRALHRRASRRRRAVALTFDDGPSVYTRRVLRILRRFHARATFFLVGTEVRRYPGLARRELRAGNELANHSLRHSFFPSGGDLRATNGVIRRATGFKPCMFRPPGGFVGGGLVRSALGLGMTTVIWSVDPRDWSRPGSGAIAQRALGPVRPGSIVLLHDGGGPRSQTVAALPRILRALRRRHYRLVTLSRLLGGRLRFSPR